jgi:hypothetical protein
MNKRQKYSNGGSISASKTFKNVGDLDVSVSGAVSGNTSNINKQANVTVGNKKGSLSYSVRDNEYSKPSSSFRATAKTGKSSNVGATKNKYEKSLDFNTETKYKTRYGLKVGERNSSPFAEFTISKPL